MSNETLNEQTIYQSLDLDINNYTVADLERFFRLKMPYNVSDVEYKEYMIREQLLNSGHVNKKFKAELISFLEASKRLIISVKCPSIPTPTTIPSDFRLDPTPNIPFSKKAITTENGRMEELIFPTNIRSLHTTDGNKFYTGLLNPLESRLKTMNICIDTLFRKNYKSTKSTDYIYVLPKIINNVVSLKLSSFEFPVVWNTFSTTDNNNSLFISLYQMKVSGIMSNDTINQKIILPDGIYTQNLLIQTLNNIFNENSGGVGLNYLWCEIDPITQSTIIRARDSTTESTIGGGFPFDKDSIYYSPDFYFTINFGIVKPLYKNLGWIIGYREPSYTIYSTNTLTSYVATNQNSITYKACLKSESFFGNNINNYLFVEIDDFQNNFPTDSIISTNDEDGVSYQGKNIIARLIINSGSTNTTDNGSDCVFKIRNYFGPVNLEKMKIRILNRFGEVINIGQNDYSMTFELTLINTVC